MGEKLPQSQRKGGSGHYVMVIMDGKLISRTRSDNDIPAQARNYWTVYKLVKTTELSFAGLPQCALLPAGECSRDQDEWVSFLTHLQTTNNVAVVISGPYKIYILPPAETLISKNTKAACRYVKSPNSPEPTEQHGIPVKNYLIADPSYLKTLGQAHSEWIFGAIAELIDNSRDAKAKNIQIFIEMIYFKKAGKDVPMLSVIDDGRGMTYQDIVRMTCSSQKRLDEDEPGHMGRFGIGFKTGSMRLGKDALVLTQTADSRSIALVSQSLNEGNDKLEIPIINFHRRGHIVELNTTVQPEASAENNLKAIKEFSPFDEYLIGQKAGLFHEPTGTQICIWNLDEWGSDYTLEWLMGRSINWSNWSSDNKGDICIRSRRSRSRPGKIVQKVPLDYSLRTYLEVIFLVPRTNIYVQGSQVASRLMEKFLNRTVVKTGSIMGKHVRLTLGRSQLDWEQANCGVFLYWHGRLIEAYKKVGRMINDANICRGLIGVIDVTDLMNDGKGGAWVLNNKQGFQDCEAYAELESWLGHQADEYLANNSKPPLQTKRTAPYPPDQKWVQCYRCRKWRKFSPNCAAKDLPKQWPNVWTCSMDPFLRSCMAPEENIGSLVMTSPSKRPGHDYTSNGVSEGDTKVFDRSAVPRDSPQAKRLRNGSGEDLVVPPSAHS